MKLKAAALALSLATAAPAVLAIPTDTDKTKPRESYRKEAVQRHAYARCESDRVDAAVIVHHNRMGIMVSDSIILFYLNDEIRPFAAIKEEDVSRVNLTPEAMCEYVKQMRQMYPVTK